MKSLHRDVKQSGKRDPKKIWKSRLRRAHIERNLSSALSMITKSVPLLFLVGDASCSVSFLEEEDFLSCPLRRLFLVLSKMIAYALV